jgi:hypothetical protein
MTVSWRRSASPLMEGGKGLEAVLPTIEVATLGTGAPLSRSAAMAARSRRRWPTETTPIATKSSAVSSLTGPHEGRVGTDKRIVDAGAQFRSLAEPWTDTGTSMGPLILAMLDGLADMESVGDRAANQPGLAAVADAGPARPSNRYIASFGEFEQAIKRQAPVGAEIASCERHQRAGTGTTS